ncbi:MAG TPA: DUF2269 family protein [Rhodanobacteraceae bacterium]|nr:DUF2269 family protein [Rhodanobacteraceae bacterium]
MTYVWLKFLHIVVAIVALGTSAGLGILLELHGSDHAHGPFVLRAIERMTEFVVLPGYLLMLATGAGMAGLVWPFTALWIQLALGLWVIGIADLVWSIAAIRKQRRLHARDGSRSAQYRQAVLMSRVSGVAFGAIILAITYLMVFKP